MLNFTLDDFSNMCAAAVVFVPVLLALGLFIGLAWRGPTGTKFTAPYVIVYFVLMTAAGSALAFALTGMPGALGVVLGTLGLLVLQLLDKLFSQ